MVQHESKKLASCLSYAPSAIHKRQRGDSQRKLKKTKTNCFLAFSRILKTHEAKGRDERGMWKEEY
jgi:hypothetical protein